MTAIMEGKNLAATLDCKACHKEAEKSVGPAYKMVQRNMKGIPKPGPTSPIKSSMVEAVFGEKWPWPPIQT